MKKHALLLTIVVLAWGCASKPPEPTPAEPAPAEPVASAPTESALEPSEAVAEAPAPAKPEGPWRVSLISVKTETKAEKLSRQFSDKGYRVEIEMVELEGTTWRRVVFPGQNSMDESKQLLAKLEEESGIKGGWVPGPRNAEP